MPPYGTGHVERERRLQIPDDVRQRVLDRDNAQCQLCGDGGDTRLQLHHIEYRSHGGRHIDENLVTLCFRCHEAVHRGDTDLRLLETSPGTWAVFPATPHPRRRTT